MLSDKSAVGSWAQSTPLLSLKNSVTHVAVTSILVSLSASAYAQAQPQQTKHNKDIAKMPITQSAKMTAEQAGSLEQQKQIDQLIATAKQKIWPPIPAGCDCIILNQMAIQKVAQHAIKVKSLTQNFSKPCRSH
nr:hypothetical protein [Psychrobacter sp. PraFG1]UNK05866.1 hypothetical protein MN210_03550 [Psychrobacter sp. PraFG1]